MGRETFRPQALGQGFLPYPWRWIKRGSSKGACCPLMSCSGVRLFAATNRRPGTNTHLIRVAALLREVEPAKQTAHARMIQPYFYQRSLFPYQTSEQRQAILCKASQ